MLLKTRFYIPPLRKRSVLRESLVEKLKVSAGGELILVSAPAGYGKTTLVSQWLHANPHTFAWLSLDRLQRVSIVFWEHFVTAIHNIQPDVGGEALNILRESDDELLESAVFSLLNDLDDLSTLNNSREPLTLVLDDFHCIERPLVLDLMNLFLDHIPPSIRLVLIARAEPALALAKRRANNQLRELSVSDLTFNQNEGRLFLNETMSLALSDVDVVRLCENTEGWIVGLQLAALSLKKPDAGPIIREHLDRHISDYLFEEVFALQTEEVQLFLMISSCVPKFCAGLCNKILDKPDSLKLIALLDQMNLFLVPLDNHRTWFRYHDLFRHFLMSRFLLLSEKSRGEYYLQSAEWFETAGYLEEALEQFIVLQNWMAVVTLLDQVSEDKKGGGGEGEVSLTEWIESIPVRFLSQLSSIEINTLYKAKMKATKNDLSIAVNMREPRNSESRSIPSAVLNQESPHQEPLTRREAQVKQLVSQGMPNKVIASELNISVNTLKVHIRNLYGKMGVENRTEALLKMNQQSPCKDS